MTESLFTPWRYDYIKQRGSESSCFLCAAAGEPDDPERLVVHRAEHHLVMLNRHPYTNGHLMIAPVAHVAAPDEAAPEARGELWALVIRAQQVLAAYSSPDGFNLGANLGSAAGAGVPGHFHFHVVPRWRGDTNFMGAVGQVRIIPQDLGETWSELRRCFAERSAEAAP